jgi:hypothetical protein
VGEFAAARTRFTAADFAATHVEALHALRAFSANTTVVLAALTALGQMAQRADVAFIDTPDTAALVPEVLRALRELTGLPAVAVRCRRESMAWLFGQVFDANSRRMDLSASAEFLRLGGVRFCAALVTDELAAIAAATDGRELGTAQLAASQGLMLTTMCTTGWQVVVSEGGVQAAAAVLCAPRASATMLANACMVFSALLKGAFPEADLVRGAQLSAEVPQLALLAAVAASRALEASATLLRSEGFQYADVSACFMLWVTLAKLAPLYPRGGAAALAARAQAAGVADVVALALRISTRAGDQDAVMPLTVLHHELTKLSNEAHASAASDAADQLAAAASPVSLLHLHFWHGGNAPSGRRLIYDCTLEALFDAMDLDALPYDLRVSASAEAPAVPLRDALRQKVPVPGIGMLPAARIPDELRRRFVLEGLVCSAGNAAGVLRVLQGQRARGATTCGGAAAGLSYLATVPDWLPADFDAAHAEALCALRSFPYHNVRIAALLLLEHMTSMAALRFALCTIELAAEVLCAMEDPLVADLRHRRTALNWLFQMEGAQELLPHRSAIRGNFMRGGLVAIAVSLVHTELGARAAAHVDNDALVFNVIFQAMYFLALYLAMDWRAGHRDGCAQAVVAVLRAPAVPTLNIGGACNILTTFLDNACPKGGQRNQLSAEQLAVASVVAESPAIEMATQVLLCGDGDANYCSWNMCAIFCAAMADSAYAYPHGGVAGLATRAQAAGTSVAVDAALRIVRRERNAEAVRVLTLAEAALKTLSLDARTLSAESAAAELLAEEAASAERASAKAARKAAAKAKLVAAAAAAADAAAEARRAAEELRAAEAAAAAAEREAAQLAQRQRREREREEQARAAQPPLPAARPAPHAVRALPQPQRPPPPVQQLAAPGVRAPPPALPPAPAAPLPETRMSDAQLAEVFPWMRIEEPPPPPPPPQPAAGASAAAEEDDGDDGCCAICMDAERDTALEPCGHALLCSACAHKVLRTAVPACPVCRVPATGCRAA